jgi:hypothetical protein
MSVKSWLGASIATNVALIGLVSIEHWKSDQLATTPPIVAQLDLIPNQAEGSSDHEKVIALAELEARARAENPPPQIQFWKSDADLQVEAHRSKVEEQQAKMREALIARFGPAASEDVVFARLFRPLDGRFPYLSSSSQLAIARLQRTRVVGTGQMGVPRRVERSEGVNPVHRDREFDSAVRAALSEEEFDTYQLRESRGARQLRASGIVVNETEFRSAIKILERVASDSGPKSHLEAQVDLNRLLGRSRFVRFLASRDLALQKVRNVALELHIQENQVLSVYDAIVSAQLRVLEAQSNAGADRSAAVPLIREIIASRDAQIAAVVGEQSAKEIMKAYASELMSMSRRTDVAAL